MSYSSNPLLPKARAEAVRLVVEQKDATCGGRPQKWRTP
jgi:hypothetical protein